jgi:hypothetical protein
VSPHDAITRFLERSRQPVVIEPGDDPIPIGSDNFLLEGNTLQVWSDTHNLVRQISGIRSEQRGRLELEVRRFRGTGKLILVDLANPAQRDAPRRGARLKYRERFRRSLTRQFPDWRLAELSTEADLHHSLSPSYPRALLRKGTSALAAIGAADDSLDPDGALTFGLIWLDYLRRRETRLSIEGLAICLPAGRENTTCHRVRYLAGNFIVLVHHPDGYESAVDPRDYTNFDTRVDACRQALGGCGSDVVAWVEALARIEDVERRNLPDGSVSLAVAGLEFARARGDGLKFGLDRKHPAGEQHLAEIETLARELAHMRRRRENPLYSRHPEAWLESQVRRFIERIDATLLETPLYGQVPQFAAGERGILDILASDRDSRLAIVEVKASEDVHLPLQALDYWMRVKWHLERGEFSGRGYFPGRELRREPPRLLLLAPALDFHPTNEILLRFFSEEVEVERIGVGLEWRQDLRVMFRSIPHGGNRSKTSKAGAD